jgi:hypothetical protein
VVRPRQLQFLRILAACGAKMKRGTIKVEAGKPLQFADAVETDSSPSAEQQGTNVIADAIKAYLVAARDLLKGKYACYAEFVPQHLQKPCNTFVIRCPDGVLVRYDVAAEDDARLRVAATNESLTELAPKFSDFLVHFGGDPERLNLGENTPGLTMAVVDSTGVPQQTMAFRLGIFTTGQLPDGFQLAKPPTRPVCLVSLTNELIVEMGGLWFRPMRRTCGRGQTSNNSLRIVAFNSPWDGEPSRFTHTLEMNTGSRSTPPLGRN